MKKQETNYTRNKFKKKRIIIISIVSVIIVAAVSIFLGVYLANASKKSTTEALFAVSVSSYVVDSKTNEKTLVEGFDTTRNYVDFNLPITTPEIEVDLSANSYFLFIYTLSNKTSDDYIFSITENITEKENVTVTYKITGSVQEEEQNFSDTIDGEVEAQGEIEISIFVYINDLDQDAIFKGDFSLSFASLSGGEV